METFVPKSSNIVRVEYDQDTKAMVVVFVSGQSWQYDGVPFETYLGMQNAQSAGSYFFRHIREVYPSQEI